MNEYEAFQTKLSHDCYANLYMIVESDSIDSREDTCPPSFDLQAQSATSTPRSSSCAPAPPPPY